MLGRRELSELQVRQRLGRRGHSADEIDAAIVRLKEQRLIDDDRVADAIARTETTIKRRGRLRVRRQIESAGIAPATARRAVDEVFESVDADQLLDAALSKRLRGREAIADDREFNRIFRYLIGQGFEPERVIARLKRARNEQRRIDAGRRDD